jgi:hypothetical protein
MGLDLRRVNDTLLDILLQQLLDERDSMGGEAWLGEVKLAV